MLNGTTFLLLLDCYSASHGGHRNPCKEPPSLWLEWNLRFLSHMEEALSSRYSETQEKLLLAQAPLASPDVISPELWPVGPATAA